jgi:2-keto-3-deoxy-L-rhamnonate aldolase RhmA
MRTSKILTKIRSGQVARICILGHFLPYFPKLAAHFGYDGVWVDGEHRAFDNREQQALLAFHRLANIDCIWRVPTTEKGALYRALEDGATGIMVPHVHGQEKARMMVQALKFPPLGDRGMDGAGLDSSFSLASPESYLENSNRNTCLVVQIETPEGLNNVDAIAAVEGVDVLFLGPGDLSLRLGCSPSMDDPSILAAQKRIARAAANHGKSWGQPVANGRDAARIIEVGARFVAMGNEFAAIHSHLKQSASAFDQAVAAPAAATKPDLAR